MLKGMRKSVEKVAIDEGKPYFLFKQGTQTMRNQHTYSLYLRAGNAGVAVAVDTRPKTIPNKKKTSRVERKKTRAFIKKGAWAE